jgi:hypothetical protein
MQGRAQEVLAFVRQHGRTHPKDVQAHFEHGRIKRWGGDLSASTYPQPTEVSLRRSETAS